MYFSWCAILLSVKVLKRRVESFRAHWIRIFLFQKVFLSFFSFFFKVSIGFCTSGDLRSRRVCLFVRRLSLLLSQKSNYRFGFGVWQTYAAPLRFIFDWEKGFSLVKETHIDCSCRSSQYRCLVGVIVNNLNC